ncbi:MAG: hypothetical protein R6X16_17125 [Anaerolineae bacterium]
MSVSGFPERLLLTGVPRVAFYSGGARCPEDITFASCLRAALEYLGECPGCRHLDCHASGSPISCSYASFLGVTGHAFSLVWKPGWDAGNGDLRWIASDPAEPFRRGLQASGHSGTVLLRGNDWPDEAAIRVLIVESLQAGRPVITLGVAGPPEAGLLTGYDAGGDVLMGSSFFQEMPEFSAGLTFEPTGEFRSRDWYARMEGLITLGDKAEPMPRAEQVRGALRYGLERIRTPWSNGRHTGLAAYDAWVAHLLMDGAFATENLAVLTDRFGVHDNQVGNLAELRWYGSLFLAQAAADEDKMASELLRAAACMADEHSLMWEAWGLVGGIGRDDGKVRKLAAPDVRRQMAQVIRASRARCEQAAAHLEAALDKS